jgi:hypothetical protein
MKTAKRKAEPARAGKKQINMNLLDLYRACLDNAERSSWQILKLGSLKLGSGILCI